jgi:hypothetical protein
MSDTLRNPGPWLSPRPLGVHSVKAEVARVETGVRVMAERAVEGAWRGEFGRIHETRSGKALEDAARNGVPLVE